MFSFKNQKLNCLPVELEDGSTIHIKPPSKRLACALVDLLNDTTTEGMIEFVADVLSDNLEGVKYTADDLENMPYPAMAKFIGAYQDFLTETLTGKN